TQPSARPAASRARPVATASCAPMAVSRCCIMPTRPNSPRARSSSSKRRAAAASVSPDRWPSSRARLPGDNWSNPSNSEPASPDTLMAIPPFHLAFPVDDLAAARGFYGELLGCPEGRSAEDWVDFDLYGHQIVAHLAPEETRQAATNAV